MRTLTRRLLLGTAIVSAGVLGTATAAQAAPTGCVLQVGVPARGANVWCEAGTGEYRVGVECMILKPGGPVISWRYGPWVNIQARSSIACAGGSSLTDAWYETRAVH